jgi:putative addiction module component (TIGR02574 family)
MNQRIKTIFADAQKLSPSEREELAELLLATIDVDADIESDWAKEIEDRIAAHERGEMTARPVREVLAKYLKP